MKRKPINLSSLRGLRVTITKCDIKHGNRAESDSCPIARATLRAIKQFTGRRVGIRVFVCNGIDVFEDDGSAGSEGSEDCKFFNIPAKADAFIREFDKGLPVQPFSFVLR